MRPGLSEPNLEEIWPKQTWAMGPQHPHSQGREHFQLAAQAEAAGSEGLLKGGSTGEAEGEEVRLSSSLPSKTSRGRGPLCGPNICSVYGLDQRYLENVAASLLFPCSSPVAHHRSQRAKFRPLCRWAIARRRPLSKQRGKERWEVGGILEKKSQTPPKGFWTLLGSWPSP